MRIFWTILRSYLWRWQFWLVLLFWLCQLAGYAMASRQQGGREVWPMLLMGVGYTSAAIAFQMKEQLGAYRAALLPGFRAPHLAVGMLWLAIAVLPFPLVTALGGGSALGALGVALPMAGLAIAGCCRGGWRGALFGIGFLLVFVPAIAAAAAAMAVGQHPWAAWGLCLAGFWLLAETVVFLYTMDEETPGYDVQFRGNLRQLRGGQARRNMLTAMRRLDREKSIWLRLVDVQIPAAMPFVGDSRWRRIVHWRRAQANWWVMLITPAFVWAMMMVVQYSVMQSRPNYLTLALRSTFWVLVMMPSTVATNAWQMRGGMLARELTYPVRRRDFVVEQGVAILAVQLLAWLVLVALMALALACLPGTPPWGEALTAVVISGPWQLVAFATLARLGTLNSAIPMLIGLVCATVVGTLLLMGCILLGNLPASAGVGAASLVLGGGCLAIAYRHWLRVDIV